jgi:hypothetical protein
MFFPQHMKRLLALDTDGVAVICMVIGTTAVIVLSRFTSADVDL